MIDWTMFICAAFAGLVAGVIGAEIYWLPRLRALESKLRAVR